MVEDVLSAAFRRGLTEWQLENLARNSEKYGICCGENTWYYHVPPDIWAPEVLANHTSPPLKLPTTIPECYSLTFRKLCQASGVALAAFDGWKLGCTGIPLSRYTQAMYVATEDQVRDAIEEALL